MADIFGFLNINKPLGMTSHDVVAKIRRAFKLKKVGHAGTLDPLAQGVLVLCLGDATRLSDYVMHSQKIYLATICLGIATTTYDAEGEITAQADPSAITYQHIEAILPQFMGQIEQVPPIYSAIKRDGKKLYELARAGETIDIPARTVHIHNLKLLAYTPPVFRLEITCASGTYIRSLAHDMGQILGVGAHLAGLVRARSGSFSFAESHLLEDVIANPSWQNCLVDEKIALAHLPQIILDEQDVTYVLHGRSPLSAPLPTAEIGRAYASNGTFIALLRAENGTWRPHKVFAANFE